MTSKLRVALVIGQLHAGGSERQLTALARGLRGGPCEPIVYCLSEVVWPFGPELEQSGILLRVFRRRHSLEPKRVLGLARKFREDRIDVALSFAQHVNLYTYLATLLARRGIFLASNRVMDLPEGPLERWINGMVYRRARFVVSNSTTGADSAVRIYGISRNRIDTIPNGIDAARFQHRGDPAPLQVELGLPPEAPVVGLVGRITAQKRVDLFLEAARLIHARIPECRFLIVGTGDLLDTMRRRSSEMGIDSRVLFTGARDDVPALLALLDLLVLCSDFEGQPNAVMEAMAAGRPVIATDLGGCRELVVEGVTGFLIPPGDFQALAARTLQLLELPDRGRSLGEAGLRRITSHFSITGMVKRFQDLFLRTAPGQSPSP